jgi:multidrug efflux pump
MTSMAFILGVLPLVLASGAGSASQRAIGTGVMSGMLSATALAVFFVPVFFVVVRSIFKWKPREQDHVPDAIETRTEVGGTEGRP